MKTEEMVRALMVLLTTAGCTTTVTKPVPVEVKVPVTIPCVVDKPQEVKALRDRIKKDQWAALSTDQRQSLLLSQGLDRKAFGDKAMTVIAGCPE